MKQTVLFIGLIWPEPEATAAGIRILQLIKFFQYYDFEVVFCSASKKTELSFNFDDIGVKEVAVVLNDASFDSFIQNLKPDFVVFDRFLTEEQFGWRIEDLCPDAIKILDTEDLHFLRKNREKARQLEFASDDLAKREIASIYRCDLSLIISEFEMQLLQEKFNIPPSLICYLPFLEKELHEDEFLKYPSFNQRQHFISMGNFKHEPNWKAVLHLKKEIWPQIRRSLPETELHIYGAYTPEKAMQLHNSEEGFLIKGWAPDAETAYTAARVLLAPIYFGAGIKGKLVYSMKFGTPNITYPIGAEGMEIDTTWNGYIAKNSNEFAEKAISLYNDEQNWKEFQKIGGQLFNKRFSEEQFYPKFRSLLKNIDENKIFHRSENFIGAMLKYHKMRSTKFLSKYIELKNRN